jgi:hypothetical protein
MRCLLTSTVVLACLGVAAEPSDPLKSAECERAVQQLQARETEAASASRSSGRALRADGGLPAPDARLLALRRQAAHICLGSRADAPPPPAPQRQTQAPITVAPVGPARPVRAIPPPAPPTPPSPRAQAPTTLLSCDPTGCWASDGSRLNRMGQNLLGPRGLCTVQGTLVQCP